MEDSRTEETRVIDVVVLRDRNTGTYFKNSDSCFRDWVPQIEQATRFKTVASGRKRALQYMARENLQGSSHGLREIEVVQFRYREEITKVVTVEMQPTVVDFFDESYTPA